MLGGVCLKLRELRASRLQRRAACSMLAKAVARGSCLRPGCLCCRYRTQLCKDGLQCNRPVCFFAHTMQQLRLGSLPASLRTADGAQFAAYYGGPAYGRMRSAAHGHASAGEVPSPLWPVSPGPKAALKLPRSLSSPMTAPEAEHHQCMAGGPLTGTIVLSCSSCLELAAGSDPC